MDAKELNALIALLDDPDKEVFNSVSDKIIYQGTEIIPVLERAWETSANNLVQSRLENLIHSIQYNNTFRNISGWLLSETQDLLKGAYYIALYQYPDLQFKTLEKPIDLIKRDIWLELNKNLTALEKVRIINHIIYDVHGYSGNTTNFFSPQNQFINQVFELKKGGPVVLAIIYAVVAQKLGLPIYPVNLPKNFILAYKDRFQQPESSDPKNSILFYINPFNKGLVLGRKEIEYFLNHQQIPIKDEYFLPCSNVTTIIQLIQNLISSYDKLGNVEKIKDLKQILTTIENHRV